MVKFVIMPQSTPGSPVFEAVTFLVWHTYDEGKLALNRVFLRISERVWENVDARCAGLG